MDLNKLTEKLKQFMSKKYVANIIVVVAILIIGLIAYGDLFTTKGSSTKDIMQSPMDDVYVQDTNGPKTEEEVIEQRLKAILENIRGVGEATVMVTFETGTEIIPASNTVSTQDTTEEQDANGGTRTVLSQSDTQTVVTSNDSQSQSPLVLKEIKPNVNGVIVVAEGAENIVVKSKLYDAVKTVLQVPGHKVQIYPK
ncbi:stage III sporulation protein AG [Serpentinicella sp. ANB-PHB4]|uniref:stage III sporulation protein AG n=1 Tax=Serpentinicella sp. ANB-PHB4 TaxID=3074076 RepID=UPI0028670666|nr:stage III sporulation protein AG [Serpentinicella sp. ANB-PHB4]MDR5658194.1 stage III sporulation protein AG [Serpentinicella sp. ANB-PHB4]